MDGLNHSWNKRKGYIPYSQTNDLLIGMILLIGSHLLCDGGKQIASRQLLVIFIDLKHGICASCFYPLNANAPRTSRPHLRGQKA